MNPLEVAIRVSGGQAAFARRIGVSSQVVRYWRKARVPVQYWSRIEQQTGVKAEKFLQYQGESHVE